MAGGKKFEHAVGELLHFEGGYVNDLNDPGGETNYGISKRSYPDLDIAGLTREDAIEIYRRDWWGKYGYGEIEDKYLASKVLSLSVNMGAKRAHRLVQLASNATGGDTLKIDGILGPLSFAAVNSHPSPGWLMDRLKILAVRFYLELDRPKYLAGWIRRTIS